MRLLIAKLASASVQSVSVALNSETDLADLATDLESCVQLVRGGSYDLVLLIVSHGRLRARDAIARLRREAGHVPMVVLTEPGAAEGASVAGALAVSQAQPGRAPAALADLVEPTSEPGIAAPWMWDEPPQSGGAQVLRARTHRMRSGPRRIVIDGDSETLRVDDQPVGLSQAEFRIFARLWESRGHIVSAEDLMGAIYGQGDRPASRVLPVFLFKLRRKLTPLGLGDLVETAIGRGFTIRTETELEAQA